MSSIKGQCVFFLKSSINFADDQKRIVGI
jgi:hypothetical protein